MSVRWLLSLLIATWLLVSIARLVFDLIGTLWLVVAFDFVQLVFLISGLFGATQKRRPLLYTLLVSNALSVTANVLIFLWYIGVFGEISRPWLSAGLPYSSSFFLRFTPYCAAEFDVIRKKWVQKSCLVPFYSIEASQAVLHVVFAVVTAIFSTLVLLETRKKQTTCGSSAQSINHYAQITASKMTPSSTSSGYDELRNQKPKAKKKKERRASMPAPDCAPSCSSKEEDVYTQPVKKKRSDLEEENRPTTVTSLVSFDPKSATLLRIRQHLEAEPSDREEQSPEPSISEYKSRTTSQDSVPSMFAPILSPGIRLSDQLGARTAYKSAFRVQQNESRVIGHYHAANEIPLSSEPKTSSTDYPVMTSGGLLV